jgi:lipoic acid synthetase
MTKPEWLTIKPASTERYAEIKESIRSEGLHTVCVEAHCPNITECWSGGTATFMVLGDVCTRGCRFCAVAKKASGNEPDKNEPEKLGRIIKLWGLDYVVITSVCRDDLKDHGAEHISRCVEEIRKENPDTIIEVLSPDFRGDYECIERLVSSRPDVIGNNIETVKRLSPFVRDRRADYMQTLEFLKGIKKINPEIYTKSAIMLGMGESPGEVIEAFNDLRNAGVDFLAVGQYLRPSLTQIEVKEYVSPERFAELKKFGEGIGFEYVASGPFVRSSYRAGEFFVKRALDQKRGSDHKSFDLASPTR